jgi:hypothetical protein
MGPKKKRKTWPEGGPDSVSVSPGVAGFDFPVFCVPVGQSSEKKVVGAPVNPGLAGPSDLAIGCDSPVPVPSKWGTRKVFGSVASEFRGVAHPLPHRDRHAGS